MNKSVGERQLFPKQTGLEVNLSLCPECFKKRIRLLSLFFFLPAMTIFSCSIFPGPSKPEIIVELEEMPLEDPIISNPQWDPGGDYIYFICWNFEDTNIVQAICRTDPEGKGVEVVKRVKGSSLLCEVAPVGNRLAYWEKETMEDGNISWGADMLVITDLEGEIIDTIHTYESDVYAHFSKVSDSIIYVIFPYEGLRRYNLNSGQYELILAHNFEVRSFPLNFDLFPGDTAVVVMDTIFSFTSNSRTGLPIKDCNHYSDCTVNQTDPRYIAFTGCQPADSLIKRTSEQIMLLDVLADTMTMLDATPRDTKYTEYQSVNSPEFSPDGNSIVYKVFRDQAGWQGFEIGIMKEVLYN